MSTKMCFICENIYENKVSDSEPSRVKQKVQHFTVNDTAMVTSFGGENHRPKVAAPFRRDWLNFLRWFFNQE